MLILAALNSTPALTPLRATVYRTPDRRWLNADGTWSPATDPASGGQRFAMEPAWPGSDLYLLEVPAPRRSWGDSADLLIRIQPDSDPGLGYFLSCRLVAGKNPPSAGQDGDAHASGWID
jgi:hypothetical protein